MGNWTEIEESILQENYPNLGLAKVSKLLPYRSYDAIRVKAKRLGLAQVEDWRRKYSFDYSFFSESNNLTCYWAGFIAADGCVQSDKGEKAVSIHLGKRDKAHLLLFASHISFTGKIYEYGKTNEQKAVKNVNSCSGLGK